jgi:hypothetical protein
MMIDLRNLEPRTVRMDPGFWQSRRRPAAAMSIEDHIIAARILQTVVAARLTPEDAEDDLSFVSTDLIDWFGEELDDGNVSGIIDAGAKYDFMANYERGADTSGPYAKAAKSRQGLIDMLYTLEGTLRAAYPKCIPLRIQVKRIHAAIRIIANSGPLT